MSTARSGSVRLDRPLSKRILEIADNGPSIFSVRTRPKLMRAASSACGYKLANDGIDTRSLQAYLGHSNIQTIEAETKIRAARIAQGCFATLQKEHVFELKTNA